MDCGLRTTEYIKHGPGIKCELRAVLVRLPLEEHYQSNLAIPTSYLEDLMRLILREN